MYTTSDFYTKRMEPILTVNDVAKLLNISPRMVYDHQRALGGFYPFGIKSLRFRPEVIRKELERQKTKLWIYQVGKKSYGKQGLKTGRDAEEARVKRREEVIAKAKEAQQQTPTDTGF